VSTVIRLALLSLLIAISTSSESALAAEYKLVMSQDDKVCKHMLNVFNKDLAKYGRAGKYDAHEEFLAIAWKDQSNNYANDLYSLGDVRSAQFDINNDGKDEFVINVYGGVGGSYLYVFRDPSIESRKKHWSEEIHGTSKGSLTGGWYELRKLSPPLKKEAFNQGDHAAFIDHQGDFTEYSGGYPLYEVTGLSIMEPFVYQGTSYIAMPSTDETEWRQWMVIAKYKEGKLHAPDEQGKVYDQEKVMEDICYFVQIGRKLK
jgi:hypothetical protein